MINDYPRAANAIRNVGTVIIVGTSAQLPCPLYGILHDLLLARDNL